MNIAKKIDRKRISIAVAAAFALVVSAGVLAGLGDDDDPGGAQDININGGRPGGGECNCPQVYDPVTCKVPGPNGTVIKQTFSNACFAGCAGATECRPAGGA
jgi:hypothetical protein